MSSKINVVYVDVVNVELPERGSTTEQEDDKLLQPIEPVEKVVMKRPKTSRTKKTIKEEQNKEEPERETQLINDTVKEEPLKEEPAKEEPIKKNIKTVELVECPKCGKKLTKRTLNYSHMAVCPSNGDRPQKKNVVKKQESEYGKYLDEGVEPMYNEKLQRVNRIRTMNDKYKHLISNAF